MAKMFIPALNTKLQVTKDWDISLFCDQRNRTLWDLASGMTEMARIPLIHRKGQMAVVRIPEGSILTVDRVYIRKDQEGYNSVTLRGWVEVRGTTHRVRFWVMLADFNKLEAEVVP